MKLNVERLPESLTRLEIAAEDAEYQKAFDRAYRKVAATIQVPGFRKGKAPRSMIERLYGREVFVEETNRDLMERLYRDAVEQAEVVPVGDPQVEITQAEPLTFAVTIPVFPAIDPGAYTEVRVEPEDATVEESAVDEVLEGLRKSQSPWVDPAEEGMTVGADLVLEQKTRTPREGDQITIDLDIVDNGEPFQQPVEDAVFVLGEDSLFDQLRERIQTLRVGESATLDIAFAEDDESVSEKVRGKTLTYTVALKGLKERDLLPLDDDFAKTVGESDTLAALKQEIRDDLHQGKTNETRTSVLNKIINKMAEGATVDPPAVMVDEEVEDEVKALRSRLMQQRMTLEEYLRVSDLSLEELKATMRPDAARRLRNSLLLREIAKREDIVVADDDVDAEVDAIVSGTEDPDKLREVYGGNYFRGLLRGDLFERRITDRLIAIATEGRGAVVNGWVAPEPEPEPEPEAGTTSSDVADGITPVGADAHALDDALTTGAMPGQPGGSAATATSADPDATVSVADVAAEPDVAQAAATGHEAESAAVAADAPADAVTPAEHETGATPPAANDEGADIGRGGVLADPDY